MLPAGVGVGATVGAWDEAPPLCPPEELLGLEDEEEPEPDEKEPAPPLAEELSVPPGEGSSPFSTLP